MLHIPKREFMGCAVATAAMLADVTYEQAADEGWPSTPERLRWDYKLKELLESLTNVKWKLSSCWWPARVRKYRFPDWPVAVFIEEAWPSAQYGQWVAVRGRLIHDPGYACVFPAERYPLRDWFVTNTLVPASPERLTRDTSSRRRVAYVLQELSAEMAVKDLPLIGG